MHQQLQLKLFLAYMLIYSIFKLKQTFPLRSYFRCFMYQHKSSMKKYVPLWKWKKCALFTLRRYCPSFKNCIRNLKRIYTFVFFENGVRTTELYLFQAERLFYIFYLLDLLTFNSSTYSRVPFNLLAFPKFCNNSNNMSL